MKTIAEIDGRIGAPGAAEGGGFPGPGSGIFECRNGLPGSGRGGAAEEPILQVKQTEAGETGIARDPDFVAIFHAVSSGQIFLPSLSNAGDGDGEGAAADIAASDEGSVVSAGFVDSPVELSEKVFVSPSLQQERDEDQRRAGVHRGKIADARADRPSADFARAEPARHEMGPLALGVNSENRSVSLPGLPDGRVVTDAERESAPGLRFQELPDPVDAPALDTCSSRRLPGFPVFFPGHCRSSVCRGFESVRSSLLLSVPEGIGKSAGGHC